MNNRCYRLVFNKLRGMLVAVSEAAATHGNSSHGENGPAVVLQFFTLFAMRHVAFAALAIFGLAPALSEAQIVPSGVHAPNVINTANGLPQVNISKPSGAGVSVNTYSQFDVGQKGAILNNSPTITNTQLAGQISGNPNLAPGQAASIIVNQVSSSNPSQLKGYVEVAGQKAATVVLANSSGIIVDGGGFINTSRGILTTGNPLIDGNGNLTGFNVTQGTVTVQGAGLNASNIDEVDILSRALEDNAAIYGNTLHAVTGSNSIDYASLTPTPITGSGPAPGVAIDVSQLGGMYANSITLVGTENGVGVANAGTLAAQAGDLTLTSAGQLVQSGRMSASGGNIAINAAGVQNSGTIYSAQNTTLGTSGALENSATIASQQDTVINAGSVASTGVFGAGINSDGSIGPGGNLSINSAGVLSANGQSVAAGSVTLHGVALDLSNAQIGAGTALNLTATGGNLGLVNATAGAGTSITANAAGTFDNSGGQLTSGTSTQIAAGAVRNAGGQMVAGTTLGVTTAGAFDNTQGVTQAAGQASISAASLDNTAGQILSLNGDGLTLSTTGQLTNGAGGQIGGNGAVSMQAGTLVNHGAVAAQTNLLVSAQSVNNTNGSLEAGQNATINAGLQFTNSGGKVLAGQAATISARTLDNSSGNVQATQLALNATNLVNHAGTITQYGTGPMIVNVSNLLDNSAGGTFQTNSTDLTLSAPVIDNDGGSILHAGTGVFTLTPGNGAGSFSNVGGTVISAGTVQAQMGTFNNGSGTFAAQQGMSVAVLDGVNNAAGLMRALGSLTLTTGGALTNAGGSVQAGTGATGDASTLSVQAASIDNTQGVLGNLGSGAMSVQAGSQIVNAAGVVTGNGAVSLAASSIANTQGGQVSGASLGVQAGDIDNTNGQMGTLPGYQGDAAITATGTLTNTGGQMGATRDLDISAGTLLGGGTYFATNDVTLNLQGDFTTTPDQQFIAGHNLAFHLPGTFTNTAVLQAANDLGVDAGDIENSGAMMAAGTLTTHSDTLTNTGAMVGGSVSLNATSRLSNLGPSALIGASDSNGTLELLAPDIENRDDTTETDSQATTAIFGLGSVVLAGGKNPDGSYSNANVINNVSALIQSSADMALYADQVTNTRHVMTTSGYMPADPALIAQLGISLSGCTAIDMTACSADHPYVGWATPDNPAFLTMIGGVYTLPPGGGQWNSGYQYTTYTGVALASVITAISPGAQIISGGNLDMSHTGLLQNYWSQVAAVGDLAAPATLDMDAWQGQVAPGVQVTYSGYYHYTNYDHSIGDWTLPFGDAPFSGPNPGGYTQAAPADVVPYGLPDYESTFGAGGTISGTGISINNTAGNAGLPSINLAPGQPVAGVGVGRVNG
uniref:two-partner secretion domain-containing protein n=1 Tax=Paraburkholderia ferrariae TaxID=386056 RepID=UPI0005AB59EC